MDVRHLRVFLAVCLAVFIGVVSPQVQAAGKPSIDPKFINFGYVQSEGVLPHVRWNSLTHIGTTFISYDSTGNFTNLSSFTGRDATLKAGGAAANAGVKVIMVALNSGFSSTVISSVMQSATNRTTLINNIVSAITADAYCQGVSFDFEPFTWSSATRDGMTAFFSALRTALPPPYEISVYANSSYTSTLYNIPAQQPNIDYFLYSCYDYGTGSTSHAISDANNFIPLVSGYLNAGLPAQKMVLVDSSYGRRWNSTSSSTYGATGSSNTSLGFTDGLYATTLNPTNSGPYTANYVTGDETGWYTYNDGVQHVAVWEDPAAAEYKIRLAQSLPDAAGKNNGKRLGGVGWWSLYWMGNFATSRNPISGVTGSYTRTYPHLYQLCEEILSPPGASKYVFEKFENLPPRWASGLSATGTASPYNQNTNIASCTWSLVNSPAGAGAPPNTTKAVAVSYNFSNTPGRLFFRHEILNDNTSTAVSDTNATAAHFDVNTTIYANVYTPAAYANNTVRMVVADKNRNAEASPQFSLGSAGWHTFSWNLNDTTVGNINGLTTAEPALTAGNGVMDTAGSGAKDISFMGFLIERNAGGPATGTVDFDELSYGHRNPGGNSYVINEFTYQSNSKEFVEIKGTPGAFPTNLTLRVYNSASGNVASSVVLGGQTMPASGLFVVGDTGVPNVNFVPAGWGSADNLPTTAPSALQLIDTNNGSVYDSVVYRAMGGLGDLIRQKTHNVVGEGFGWMGDTGSGTNSAGSVLAYGRYPDGADTNVNEADFSLMPPTPGTANGTALSLPASYNFASTPSTIYQTFSSPSIGAMAAGRATSTNGGNVWRCIDPAGGGTQGYIGDATLGASTSGYVVTGELYIPPSTDPAQAIGIGLCGQKGSAFFSASPGNSGYESGYWLVYESNASAALNDGQAVHSQQFLLEMANNDNMQSTRTLALGTAKTLAQVGIASVPAAGVWATFRLECNTGTNKLRAQINGNDVYNGTIPSGGPTRGAFQVGYREFTSPTSVTSVMGAWLDNINISGTASSVDHWPLY